MAQKMPVSMCDTDDLPLEVAKLQPAVVLCSGHEHLRSGCGSSFNSL